MSSRLEEQQQLRQKEEENCEEKRQAMSTLSYTTPTPEGFDDTVTLPRPVVFVGLVLILSTTVLLILYIVRGVVSLCRVCSSDTGQDDSSPRVSGFGLVSGRNGHTSSSPSPDSSHLGRRGKKLSVHFDDDSGEEPKRECVNSRRLSQDGFLSLDRAVNQGKYSKRISCGSEQRSKAIERKSSRPLVSSQGTRANNSSQLDRLDEYSNVRSSFMAPLPTITIEAPREDNSEYFPDSGSSSISISQDQSFKSWTPLDEGISFGDSEVLAENQSLLVQQNSDFQTEINVANCDNGRGLRDPEAMSAVTMNTAESNDSLTGATERASLVPHSRPSSRSLGRLYGCELSAGGQSQAASQQSFRECFCYVSSDPDILHLAGITADPRYLGEGAAIAGGASRCPSAPPAFRAPKYSTENVETSEIIESFESDPNVLEAWTFPAPSRLDERFPVHSVSSLVRKQSAQVPLPGNTSTTIGVIDSGPATQPRRFSSFEVEARRRSPSVREHRRSFHSGDDVVRLLRQCSASETSV
nr:uncharacterized protein LOC123765517 isoform X1 [Procambarus clarkii]